MRYSPAWPHSEIIKLFPNIFFVTGTNITNHDNVELQHSRNMIIIRNENKLSLINTVRLENKALASLENLGKVENVIRIGAFHGRDDAFYLDRYHAKLWAIKGMKHDYNRIADIELAPGSQMPFPNSSLFIFETSVFPEGILHLTHENGILISCDSIKNWMAPDLYFNAATAQLYEQQGFFGTASISKVWKEACHIQLADFQRLQKLKFHHLLSAHGEPLFDNAKKLLAKTVRRVFAADYT